MMKRFPILFTIPLLLVSFHSEAQQRIRDYNIEIGVLKTGRHNAITDVTGVLVGHKTLVKGDAIRTGVTAILPHSGNIFQEKVPAAIYIGNGFGKLAGYSQVEELGNIETPIILTNTLSVATAINAVIGYTLSQSENENVRSVNAIVGETNDGRLNDIRGRHVSENDVNEAITNADNGIVEEGNVGAGTGTTCFGWKGGIGTASRKLPSSLGGYTVGVIVQSNFGGIIEIAGVPIGKLMGKYPYRKEIEHDSDGSCMIVVATDAPLSERNLKRMAKRAIMGLAKTGGIASNGSGDYVIAFSTFKKNRILYNSSETSFERIELPNTKVTPLFLATIEATEEAILNSLFAAKDMEGWKGNKVKSLPVIEVIKMIRNYRNK